MRIYSAKHRALFIAALQRIYCCPPYSAHIKNPPASISGGTILRNLQTHTLQGNMKPIRKDSSRTGLFFFLHFIFFFFDFIVEHVHHNIQRLLKIASLA